MTEVDGTKGNSFGARFGRLVRNARDDLGMSAKDLTIKVWNDEGRKSSLSRLENGDIANPAAKTVQTLAAALNIPPEEIEALRVPQERSANEHIQFTIAYASVFTLAASGGHKPQEIAELIQFMNSSGLGVRDLLGLLDSKEIPDEH